MFYVETGRPQEAEAADKEALTILRALVDKYPEVTEHQSGLADCYVKLGALFQTSGRANYAEAVGNASPGHS